MSINSRINKLEIKQLDSGHVITKQCIDIVHQLHQNVIGEDRPVSYESVGTRFRFELSEETKRRLDEITGRDST